MDKVKEVRRKGNFSDSVKVIKWNRRLLGIVGLWPLEIRDSIFLPCFVYGCIHSLLGFLDLYEYSSDFDYVLMNIVENMLMLMTLAKLAICRIKKGSILQFLVETEKDYRVESYENDREKLIFLSYNKLSYNFITIACSSMITVLLLYYFKTVIPSIVMVMTNSSMEYRLPYKIKPFVKPTDAKSYAFGCIYESVAMLLVMSGYVGTDCLLTCSGFHLIAQLAILKSRVKDALKGISGDRRGFRKFILRHLQLIRLADILEDAFNYVVFQQLTGTTLHLCISGYHALLSLVDAQAILLVVFVIHACGVSSTLFVYCYVGECLIEESTSLCEALYRCDWYEMSPMDLKCVHICMMRARKPLQLTSAKFCAISLCTFSDILKTSMAYLSVLQTFL